MGQNRSLVGGMSTNTWHRTFATDISTIKNAGSSTVIYATSWMAGKKVIPSKR